MREHGGKVLKKWRTANGLTQDQLADMISCSQGMISKFEYTGSAHTETVGKISLATGIALDSLIYGETDQTLEDTAHPPTAPSQPNGEAKQDGEAAPC